MPRGPETPIPIRAGILALHLFTDMNWVDISTKFLVHPDTAKKICQRAKERAADESVNALFAALGDAERTGRPRKHADGMTGPDVTIDVGEKMQVSEVPIYRLNA